MATLRCFIALILTALTFVSADWVDYERPAIYDKSFFYSLKVNGTYARTVSYDRYDYVHLSMTEGPATEMRVSLNSQAAITKWNISPNSLPIEATVSGNELIFPLKNVHYLMIKINDLKEFVVMIDPIETSVPDPNGDNVYNVLDYGADNAGGSKTTGIQAAMDAAAGSPGSTVYVPPGLYYIGNLMLRNNTSLYLAGGAVLRNTAVKSDYNVLFTKSDLGDGTWWIQTEFDSHNIRVFGRGVLDGNGHASVNASPKLIAHMLTPVGTRNFSLDGILIRDSSFWAVVPIQSRDVRITNLKILDRFDVVQNDGIDAVESTNVRVTRALAVANDDSFSAKTWPDDVGTTVPYPYPPQPQSDVVFEDCLAWTLCWGFKIGEGVFGDQTDIVFRDSTVYRAGVGMGLNHKYGTGTARNIQFRNIDVEGLTGGTPAGVGAWFAGFIQDVGNGTGPIQDVTVREMRVGALGTTGGKLVGQGEDALVDGVTFGGIYMLGSSQPAGTLEEMDISDYSRSTANIMVDNS